MRIETAALVPKLQFAGPRSELFGRFCISLSASEFHLAPRRCIIATVSANLSHGGGRGIMSVHVFLSYSTQDQQDVQTICNALENRGIRCWLAERDIAPGENYQEAIVKAIRDAKVMVLVFTGHANNSDEIKKELSLASKYSVTVIPVRMEDVRPNDAFSYEFSIRQWIDLFADWESAIDRVSRKIASITDEKPAAPLHQARRKGPLDSWILFWLGW